MSPHLRHRAFLLCPEMFEDPRLSSLRSSRPNRQLMFDVLSDDGSGLCDRLDITAMSNEPDGIVKPRLEHWFASATDDDVLVFYYSGHAMAGDGDGLGLATATSGEHGSHTVSGHQLAAWIGGCRARQVYVIVDAAHTGPQDVRTDGRVFQMIGSGDGVVAGSPVGEPSPFTSRLAAYFATSADPSLSGLFRSLQTPGAPERAVAAPAVAAPALDETQAIEVVITPAEPLHVEVSDTPVTGIAAPSVAFDSPPPAPAPAPAPLGVMPPRRRWSRGIVGWAAAIVLVVGAAGVSLTRCGDGDEEAGSTSDPLGSATLPAGASTTVAATTVVVTTLPVTIPPTALETTTAVASEPATTLVPTTLGPTTTAPARPATIDLGIAGHPLTSPPCTGGWIAQLASVNASSEFAGPTVTELLGADGSSYTYGPDSCPTFDSGNWYVVYLGPFATRTDAMAACEESGDEDCFARQLQ